MSPDLSPTLEACATFGIVVLFVLNALLNACETALHALRPHFVRPLRESDAKRAKRLQGMLDHRERYAAACSFGIRLVRVGMLVLVLLLAPGFGRLVHEWSPERGFGYDDALVSALILGLPLGLLNLVLGDLVPRAFGTVKPLAVLGSLSKLVRAASVVLSLPAKGIVGLASVFTERFGGTAALEGANPLEEEIKTLAESGEETGQIESDERELIHSVFEFGDTVVREIMTPRVDLDSMPVKSDPADVVRVIVETGHSRIPLYDQTDDDILGVVHAKDLLGAMAQGRAVDLGKLLRPILKVPEGKGVRDLLGEMRAARTQMAVVQDEFGGTAGVVTIEDIVEELVGDIVDEYDPEESEVVDVDGGWLVDGKTHLDDLNERIGSEFESDEFDTVGGFVFGQFGRQPQPGETIDLDRHRFTVTDTDGKRVQQLRIEAVGETSLDGPEE